jgi:GntR family transcriptional regulator, arabinose operon transcriptional repressor
MAARRPMYEQIKDDLRLQILQGAYTAGQPFVTQQQVCERYGVSMLTAARALNELEFEGLVVRHRGRGTFVAERRASTGAGPEQQSITCIVPGLNGGHIANFVRGLETVCSDRGYRLVLADSHGSASRQSRALARAASDGSRGVVIYPVDGAADHEGISALQAAGIPVVFADRYWVDVAADAVLVDDFALGYDLTTRLIARGHTAIATLWLEVACTSVRDRLSGHIKALRDHGLPVIGDLTVLRPYSTAGFGPGDSYLRRLLQGAHPPTAVLCANGFVLAAAMNDLIDIAPAGHTIEFAGMDEAGPYDTLPLAVVSAGLPSHEMGSRAAARIIDRISGTLPDDGTEHVVLPVDIHERAEQFGALGR